VATLNHDDEAWWKYAVEFARRGLWPLGEIETHGPHQAPGDRIWGEALCVDGDRDVWEILFNGPSGCKRYSDIRGLRLYTKHDESIRFPVLPPNEKNGRVKRWLSFATKRARSE
jgi:hypothetical protein